MTNQKLRITGVELTLLQLPLDKPLRTAIHEISQVACLLATVRTDAGISGEGYGFCFDMQRDARDRPVRREPRKEDGRQGSAPR